MASYRDFAKNNGMLSPGLPSPYEPGPYIPTPSSPSTHYIPYYPPGYGPSPYVPVPFGPGPYIPTPSSPSTHYVPYYPSGYQPGPGGCAGTEYGCCPDGVTPKKAPGLAGDLGCTTNPFPFVPGFNPENPSTHYVPYYPSGYQPGPGGCAGTEYGCCPDGVTPKRGPGFGGCTTNPFPFIPGFNPENPLGPHGQNQHIPLQCLIETGKQQMDAIKAYQTCIQTKTNPIN
jgi:hypothetical protein